MHDNPTVHPLNLIDRFRIIIWTCWIVLKSTLPTITMQKDLQDTTVSTNTGFQQQKSIPAIV